jgi:hypothetical protein
MTRFTISLINPIIIITTLRTISQDFWSFRGISPLVLIEHYSITQKICVCLVNNENIVMAQEL